MLRNCLSSGGARSACFLLLTALGGCGILTAADHPDFSGTWKLDASQSDFGPLPGPSQVTDRVVQTASEFTINRNREGRDSVIHVPLDGSELENNLRGAVMKTKGHWDGGALVIDYSGSRGKSEERWTLTSDGKAIKVARHLSGPQGTTDQTLTMVKADAAAH